ncbi:MAG: PA domain-containing protein [Casimicrobium sp.]
MNKLLTGVTLRSVGLLLLCAACLVLGRVEAAKLVLVNGDFPGTGFNDPTPVAPVGGNPGTTLGQQRQIAFNYVLGLWGKTLSNTDITIEVLAGFRALGCDANGGALAAAGPYTLYSNSEGTKFNNTWYHGALANRLANRDLDIENYGVNFPEIIARANINIGKSDCIPGSGWYYGLDDRAPSDGQSFVKIMLHEVGHGLGFGSLVDESTGEYFADKPGVWEHFLYDDTTGKTWVAMTDEERKASAINNENLSWTGYQSFVAAKRVLAIKPELNLFFVNARTLTGFVPSAAPGFGVPEGRRRVVGTLGFTGNGKLANDACNALTPAQTRAVKGKIAVINRGGCALTQKALNAQIAGAIGVIYVNNDPSFSRFTFGSPDERNIRIPVALISQQDGMRLRNEVNDFTTVSFIERLRRAGVNDAGRPLMFAPTAVQPGSSVSHWDVSASPNLLMEPYAVGDESILLKPPGDMTYPLFQDIGW